MPPEPKWGLRLSDHAPVASTFSLNLDFLPSVDGDDAFNSSSLRLTERDAAFPLSFEPLHGSSPNLPVFSLLVSSPEIKTACKRTSDAPLEPDEVGLEGTHSIGPCIKNSDQDDYTRGRMDEDKELLPDNCHPTENGSHAKRWQPGTRYLRSPSSSFPHLPGTNPNPPFYPPHVPLPLMVPLQSLHGGADVQQQPQQQKILRELPSFPSHMRPTLPCNFEDSTTPRVADRLKRRIDSWPQPASAERPPRRRRRRRRRVAFPSSSSSDPGEEEDHSDASPRARTRRRAAQTEIDPGMVTGQTFRGVSRHRLTQRWEASLWLAGRQLYLGGFDDQLDAAKAYDLAALSCKGPDAVTNFPAGEYEQQMQEIAGYSRDEVVAYVRRRSAAFARGRSKYRGVSGHQKRWEARIGSFGGRKNVSFGIFESEQAAARQYDRALIIEKGKSAKTNFPMSDYEEEAAAYERWLRQAKERWRGAALAEEIRKYTLPRGREIAASWPTIYADALWRQLR